MKEYKDPIAIHLIGNHRINEFNEFNRNYKLQLKREQFVEQYIMYKFIPGHALETIADKVMGHNVDLKDFQTPQMISVLRNLHDAFEDKTTFNELFKFPYPETDPVANGSAIDNNQYLEVLKAIDVSFQLEPVLLLNN